MASSIVLSDNGVSSGTAGLKSTAGNDGVLLLQTTTSGGTATTAVTLDNNQNMGLGVTPVSGLGRLFQISASGTTATIQLGTSATGSTSSDGTQLQVSGSDTYFWNLENAFISIGTNNLERARFDASGNFLVGTTSQIGSGKVCIKDTSVTYNLMTIQDTATSGWGQYIYFTNSAGAQAGLIGHTGSTTVVYTTSSDYRMKENVVPMTGALAKVAALNPVTYTWKEDGSSGEGFIAHELQEICPHAVVGEKDAVDADGNPKYQSIDTSFLVATLTAAIQEQQAIIASQSVIITQLQADVAALKGTP